MIHIPEFIQNLTPYKAGKPISELAREQNLTRIVKLASNENPLGPSPAALAAIQEGLSELHRYSDPLSHELVEAIAASHRLKPEQVICGHGTDSLIAYMVGAFTTEGQEILTSEGTFIGIYVSCKKQGRTLRTVPMKDYGFDLGTLADSIQPETRIVYLANPNNPTGTMFTKDEFEGFMQRVPKDVLVILDEAYTAYASNDPNYPNGLDYDYPNVLVTRTFSKAYGLGGLRVGFAAGPEALIQALYKIKLPFEPNYLAQMGAMGALKDDAFLEKTVKLNRESLDQMRHDLRGLGIEFVESYANFLLLLFKDEAFAARFTENCMNRGLILRHVKAFGVPNGVRINSGTIEETDFAMEIIKDVFESMS